mmetsp:Transcript_26874/g.60596  ORF Transcript_26874/g.60596 Transcript_26874/m.60596 type:complete len:265 (+) Transcript_26874:202-996(+)
MVTIALRWMWRRRRSRKPLVRGFFGAATIQQSGWSGQQVFAAPDLSMVKVYGDKVDASGSELLDLLGGCDGAVLDRPFPEYNGLTVAGLCAEACNVEGLQVLLNHNADLNVTDFSGNTLLHNVCAPMLRDEDEREGVPVVVKWLLDAKVDPSVTNDEEETCFHAMPGHVASEDIAIAVLESCRSAGANIAQANGDGATVAMLLAERFGMGRAVEWALARGCTRGDADNSGKRLDYYASQFDDRSSSSSSEGDDVEDGSESGAFD